MTSARGFDTRAPGPAPLLAAGSWTSVALACVLVLSGCDGGGAPASALPADYRDVTPELVAEARNSAVSHRCELDYTLDNDGLAVALTVAAPPRNRWDVYSIWRLPPTSRGHHSYLTFTVAEGPYAVAFLDEDRQTLALVRGSCPPASPRALACPRGAMPDSIIFYHPITPAGDIHYSSIRLFQQEGAAGSPAGWGPWVEVGAAAKERILEPNRQRWSAARANFVELVEHFQSTAAWLRRDAREGIRGDEGAGSLRLDHLRRDFESSRELLARAHGVRDATRQELLYVCYAAHFAVDLSSADGTDAGEILARGDGTCWQQAVVAAALGNALRPGAYHRVVTDPEQMGHSVTVAAEGIIDVSSNAVFFVDPEKWSGWPAWRRLQLMEQDACFGIYRGSHEQLAGVSWSTLGETTVRQHYLETIELWPRAELKLPEGWR